MQVTVASVVVVSYSAVGTAWTLQEVVVCVVVAVVDIMGVAEVMAMVVIGHGGRSARSWDSCNRGQAAIAMMVMPCPWPRSPQLRWPSSKWPGWSVRKWPSTE